MNFDIDELLGEYDLDEVIHNLYLQSEKETDEYLTMQLSEFDKSIDDLLEEYENVDIDQLLAELEHEFCMSMQALLRDNAGTDTNIQQLDYELFDDMVRRIPVNAED